MWNCKCWEIAVVLDEKYTLSHAVIRNMSEWCDMTWCEAEHGPSCVIPY